MRFSKWHALGNSYVVLERNEIGRRLSAGEVARICDVGFGVGADGLLEIDADGASAEVVVWNPDGSRAEFSGNGARIAAAWLSERAKREGVQLRIGERDVRARVASGSVELEVGQVDVGEPERIDVEGDLVEVTPVSVGNPHAVLEFPFEEGDAERLGPLLEAHERFPERTNVQLVRVLGPSEIAVAVWERGAGATRSSGSSAVASAAAAVANGRCDAPVTVVYPGAGDLLVELERLGGRSFRSRLTGPVAEVCRGELVT